MDKRPTRLAALGYKWYLRFDEWWPLERGKTYRVDFVKRKVVEC